MVVLSCLRAPMRAGIQTAVKKSQNLSCIFPKSSNIVQVRQMAGNEKIIIRPGKFEYHQWKDDVHFFILLGVVPLGIVIAYANIFVGPSELADIPEDYVPKHWEYYKSPIKRWFARYVYNSYEKEYEKTLHCISEEMKRKKRRQQYQKMLAIQAERQDYRGWYYYPSDKSIADIASTKQEISSEQMGFSGSSVGSK